MAQLADLPPASEDTKIAAAQQTDPGLLAVAQPRGVMIQQNHISRGGYQKLKTISSIRYQGETTVGDATYAITVTTERPHRYERVVTNGTDSARVTFDGANIDRDGNAPLDLPATIQDELLASYEFDGWMTDWKAKGHQVWRLGMKKYQDRLPWIMEAELTNGRTWHIYVDSHSGDAFRQALIDDDGSETIAIEYDDYRDADGFRLPHEVRYFDGTRLLATDRFTEIHLTVVEAEPDTGA